MRATILPYAVILTSAHRVRVNMMAKGCIVAQLHNYMYVNAILMHHFHILVRGSIATGILPTPNTPLSSIQYKAKKVHTTK